MLAQDVRLIVVAVIEQRQALAQPIGEAIKLNTALGRDGEGQDDGPISVITMSASVFSCTE